MEKYVIIPKDKIARIELYINDGKKSLEQIVRERAADYAINGALFNSDWSACNHLRANGIEYASDEWTYYGLAWQNTDNRLYMAHSRDEGKYDNYVAFCEIIYNGMPKSKLTYPSYSVGGARQRTAIGFTKDGDTLLYTDTGGKTPEALRDRIAEIGNIEFCLMLDGGSSTQGYFAGDIIKAANCKPYVHSLILVYLKKEQPAPKTGSISAADIVALAAKEVGTEETAINRIKYNSEYYGNEVSDASLAWCCVFIWWLFHTLNADALYYGGAKTASCTALYNWAKAKGLAVNGGYQAGDIVFMDWDKSGDCDHAGILESVSANTVTTIEGNWNDKVSRVTRPVSDISAAYRPKYKMSDISDEDLKAFLKLVNNGWGDVIKAMAERL